MRVVPRDFLEVSPQRIGGGAFFISRPEHFSSAHGARRHSVTEDQQAKLKMQARMFDMGHAPKERVVNRVFEKVGAEPVSDEKLNEVIADEHTGDDIQELYG
jgi:hypothetical protein